MSSPKVRELFPERQRSVRQWMWRRQLEKRYWPYAGLLGDGGSLHFVLGLPGSGSEHLMRLLSQRGIALRTCKGPLQRFEPRLDFGAAEDRLALEYGKELPHDHPLLRVYRMLVEDGGGRLQQLINSPAVDEPDTLPLVVGETRALLAGEALIRQLGARLLLYVGDPVIWVDGLFADRGEADAYLLAEGRSMLAPRFLSRYCRRDFRRMLDGQKQVRRLPDERRRNIAHRVLLAGMLEHMFRMLAARYPQQVTLVEFAHLADNPYYLEDRLRQFLGDPGLVVARTLIMLSTFKPDNRKTLVWHNAWPEQNRIPRYLSPAELRMCRDLLQRSGLSSATPLPSGAALDEDTLPLAAEPPLRGG